MKRMILLVLGLALLVAGCSHYDSTLDKAQVSGSDRPFPVRDGLVWCTNINQTMDACGGGGETMDAGKAKQIIIKTTIASANNMWCSPTGTAAVGTGLEIQSAGKGVVVELIDDSDEVTCCGAGGTVDVTGARMCELPDK